VIHRTPTAEPLLIPPPAHPLAPRFGQGTDPDEWKSVEKAFWDTVPKKKSAQEIAQEGFNKTIQKHVPGYVHDTFAPVKSVTVQTDFAAQPQKLFVKYEDGSMHEVTLNQGD
jgi:hypothetical protein